jgi:transcriptional regulator with XRE-family HTH domain
MVSTRLQREAARRASETRRALGRQLLELRTDGNLTQRQLAEAAGVSKTYVARVEAGAVRPTIETYTALAAALGSDFAARIYPGTGPTIRDRNQAPIVEALIRLATPIWHAFPEVPVRAPTRGVIDLVLHSEAESVVIAAEVETELKRLEQRLRWHAEKAEALPSSALWRAAVADERVPGVSKLLVLRSTDTNRRIVREFEATLLATYPGRTSQAYEALAGRARWPGAAVLWARTQHGQATILAAPPRGIRLGR